MLGGEGRCSSGVGVWRDVVIMVRVAARYNSCIQKSELFTGNLFVSAKIKETGS